MRRLIRPGVLIVARTGLLAAVVTMCVGHWRVLVVDIGYFSACTDQVGWQLSWHSPLNNGIGLRVVDDEEHVYAEHSRRWFNRLTRFPGLAFRPGPILWVIVKHWLAISVLAVLNILLWRKGRRQPRHQPCDN